MNVDTGCVGRVEVMSNDVLVLGSANSDQWHYALVKDTTVLMPADDAIRRCSSCTLSASKGRYREQQQTLSISNHPMKRCSIQEETKTARHVQLPVWCVVESV